MPTQQERVGSPSFPTAGDWELDPSHTVVGFVGRHLGLAKVRGRFTQFSATIHVGGSPEESAAEVTIEAASLDTGIKMRDDHLRSADFLDVERFPHLTFTTTSFVPTGEEGWWKVAGDLTIKDVTRPVVLDVEFRGEVDDPMTNTKRAGFSATAEIDRNDYDMTWNGLVEIGGLVGKSARIEIEVEALLRS